MKIFTYTIVFLLMLVSVHETAAASIVEEYVGPPNYSQQNSSNGGWDYEYLEVNISATPQVVQVGDQVRISWDSVFGSPYATPSPNAYTRTEYGPICQITKSSSDGTSSIGSATKGTYYDTVSGTGTITYKVRCRANIERSGCADHLGPPARYDNGPDSICRHMETVGDQSDNGAAWFYKTVTVTPNYPDKPVIASCTVSPASAQTNTQVTWSSTASGGETYKSVSQPTWVGKSKNCSVGGNVDQCGNDVYQGAACSLGTPSCSSNYQNSCSGGYDEYASAAALAIQAGGGPGGPQYTEYQCVSSSNYSYNNSGYTFNWTGTDGLSGITATINKLYTTPGIKQGTVTVGADSGQASKSCQVTVAAPVAPNLTSSIGPAVSVVAGTAATFTGTTANSGDGTAATGFYDLFVFYGSDQSTWDSYEFSAASAALGPNAGAARSVNHSFATPGTYYYRLCADWNGNIAESNEGDNCSALQTVTVQAPVAPIPPNPTGLTHTCNAQGTQVTISWNPAPGAVDYYVRFYDGISSNPYAGYAGYNDLYTGTSITYPSVPGRAYTTWVHSRNSSGYSNPPAYDPAGGGSFTCAGQADLTAGSVSPSSATVGVPVSLSAPANNIGNSTSGSFPMLFQIHTGAMARTETPSPFALLTQYLTPRIAHAIMQAGDPPPSNDVLLNSSYVGGLAQGASVGTSASYTFPASGTYGVRACANYNTSWTAITPESNYANNCGPWTNISVAAPAAPTCALSANSPTVPSTLTWSSTGATSCTGGGFSTGGATAGSQSVATAGTYNVSCSGAGGSCTSAPVTLGNGTCTGTPVVDIKANGSDGPVRVKTGNTANITWSATNVPGASPSCTISGPGVSQTVAAGTAPTCAIPNGTATPAITTQSTYTITCAGVSDQVIVNVVPKFVEF